MNEPTYSQPRRPPRLIIALPVAGLALALLLVLTLREALYPLARADIGIRVTMRSALCDPSVVLYNEGSLFSTKVLVYLQD